MVCCTSQLNRINDGLGIVITNSRREDHLCCAGRPNGDACGSSQQRNDAQLQDVTLTNEKYPR
jgi:hypothetical protein